MYKQIIALPTLLGALASSNVFAGGFVDVTYDHNIRGKNVTTLVIGTDMPKGSEFIGIYDTTRYGEVYFGRKFLPTKGLSLTPYFGAEWTAEKGPKARGMLITSYSVGQMSATSVIEFSGNTGNFNKTTLSYKVSQTTFSVLNHSVAGSGIRIDRNMGRATPYVQFLERRSSAGVFFPF